jgi:hypothetical protein
MRTMEMIWADDNMTGHNPCAVCGREMKGGNHYAVHVIDGGDNILHPEDEDEYIDDGGDMYWHPVGPECRKKFGTFAVKN